MTGSSKDRSSLLAAGLLGDTSIDGIYSRSFGFERAVRGLEAYVSATGEGESDRRVFFPPVQARTTLEVAGYVSSFPNLLGAVSGIPERSARRAVSDPSSWTALLEPTDVTLCSAACHGLYPMLSGEVVSSEGIRYEVQSWVFRHEPSEDPARMQAFRMHEFVYVGSPEGALAHRDRWRERGHASLSRLGLDVSTVVANDPFFGRAAPMLAESQRDKELKFELVSPMTSEEPGAIASANYHEDHFGAAFGIRLDTGGTAHSACFAFGLERITLALLRRHGLRIDRWPAPVTELLFVAGSHDTWATAT